MIIIEKLIFDDWNIQHIARHGVRPDEVEQVCQGNYVVLETYGGRIMLIGENTAGQFISVVLSPKGNRTFYPVTARRASRKERKYYQEQQEEKQP